MSPKNDWLKEYLQGIDGKVDEVCNVVKSIQSTQTDLIKDNQKNWAAYEGLYGKIERHEIGKCATIVKHEDTEHKGLFGKALGYTVAIFTILGLIIAAVWKLATYWMGGDFR